MLSQGYGALDRTQILRSGLSFFAALDDLSNMINVFTIKATVYSLSSGLPFLRLRLNCISYNTSGFQFKVCLVQKKIKPWAVKGQELPLADYKVKSKLGIW